MRHQLLHALEAQQSPGEDERIARHQTLDEGLLDLAQHRPAPHLHLDQRQLDDGADIHAELPRHHRRGQHPAAVGQLLQPVPALVGRQRIAAGRHEVERVVEILARQVAIGLRAPHLVEEGVAVDRLGAGGADDVLGQHVEAGRPRRIAVELARLDGLERRQGLQHLEAVGRRDHGAARLVEPVVGAADPLHQAAHPLGRAHLDHQVDVAPVDAEIERGGGDHGAQLARRHRRLDLAPLLDGQRAVMQADRQIVLVDAPQPVEHQLGLRPCVHEHDRGLVLADDVVDLGHGVMAHMAAPRQTLLGVDDAHHGLRAGLAAHDLDLVLDREELRQLGRVGDRGRQADEAHMRRQRGHARQAKCEVMAALAGGEGMQFVHDQAFQAGEELRRVGIGEQQRQRFRRGHQAGPAAARAGAGGGSAACRRSGSRPAPAAASRRSAARDCGGCRWPAP